MVENTSEKEKLQQFKKKLLPRKTFVFSTASWDRGTNSFSPHSTGNVHHFFCLFLKEVQVRDICYQSCNPGTKVLMKMLLSNIFTWASSLVTTLPFAKSHFSNEQVER